tara:strand:- start:47 stop:232 length:186 start_codon:yes stop_codon:yes gene_type:complete
LVRKVAKGRIFFCGGGGHLSTQIFILVKVEKKIQKKNPSHTHKKTDDRLMTPLLLVLLKKN